MKPLNQSCVAVIGLGYVGLPLTVAFGRKLDTIGFDVKAERVAELQKGEDSTLEVTPEDIKQASRATYTNNADDLQRANIYIVTVPTPITSNNQPDLKPLQSASSTIGRYLSAGDVVIYESTVFPGATEEHCVPVLESESGLKVNRDFYVGYSPERIVPGDTKRRLENIVKITSGSTPEAADYVDELYQLIIEAGTYRAQSIQVAEAAKVIENVQRDVNISLVNEIAMICNRLGLDTLQVLEAAGTKWNFLPFRPGLVGGHCIGIDPYYLTSKAQEVGYHPEVILSGRRLNDNIGNFIAESVVKLMIRKGHSPIDSKVLVLGLTFKENCPDIRNTKIIDLTSALEDFGVGVDVYDPRADPAEAMHEYDIPLLENIQPGQYAAVVIAVPHEQFRTGGIEQVRAYGKPGAAIYDVKGMFPIDQVDGRL